MILELLLEDSYSLPNYLTLQSHESGSTSLQSHSQGQFLQSIPAKPIWQFSGWNVDVQLKVTTSLM